MTEQNFKTKLIALIIEAKGQNMPAETVCGMLRFYADLHEDLADKS